MSRPAARHAVGAVAALVAALVTLAVPTRADHNDDDHSDNATLLFSSPNTTGATNSDMAFWGDRAYVSNYDGFRIFDVSDPANPQQLVDFACAGPQNDVVVWQNRLLFMGIDRTLTGPECGAAPTESSEDPNGWEGIRIFDVSDPTEPRYIDDVYTDCGVHTMSLYPRSRHQLMLYVSSYPLVGGPTCGPVRGPEAGNSPLHEQISVVSVPVRAPHKAEVVAQPQISYPSRDGGVFDPAEHGLTGFNPFVACHDISVHVRLRLAAGACAAEVQLWRIKPNGIPDTAHPLWVFDDEFDDDGPGGGDTGRDFWHTARFTWDGRYIQIDDESFGDGCPPVTPGIGDTGRTHLLRTADGRRMSTVASARNPADEYCSVHQGNFVRTFNPHRYLSVTAFYQGGMSVIDFSDPRHPEEVAFYDIAPTGPEGSNNWAAYWYQGPRGNVGDEVIYGNDHHHGFEVFDVDLDVWTRPVGYLNPQTVDSRFRPRR